MIATGSVELSEIYSELLLAEMIPHSVLNAYNDAKEAQIIKEAGQKGSVTVATLMAGRGTDIKLGPGVKELGGLAVIGTEKMQNVRMELQLRGELAGKEIQVTASFLCRLKMKSSKKIALSGSKNTGVNIKISLLIGLCARNIKRSLQALKLLVIIVRVNSAN